MHTSEYSYLYTCVFCLFILYLFDNRSVECLEMMIHEGCDVNAVDASGRYYCVDMSLCVYRYSVGALLQYKIL